MTSIYFDKLKRLLDEYVKPRWEGEIGDTPPFSPLKKARPPTKGNSAFYLKTLCMLSPLIVCVCHTKNKLRTYPKNKPHLFAEMEFRLKT